MEEPESSPEHYGSARSASSSASPPSTNGRSPGNSVNGASTTTTVTRAPRAPRETDLKSVVRKLREDSESFSRALNVLPTPNRTDASQPRKKRWAARVRTGCVTCRTRRIKCDETKPACKRCTLTGRDCAYEGGSLSPASSGPSSPPQPTSPTQGPTPPSWHVKEACEYYARVMLPMHRYHAEGDSAFEANFDMGMFMNENFDPESFVMLALNHRVQCVSAANGVQAKYGMIPAINPIWARLFNQMAIAVSNLNHYMAHSRNAYFVLHRCADLISAELCLALPTWRAHASGYGALIKSYGGIAELFKLKKPPAMQTQYALAASTMANSTSPGHDQIQPMANWSDDDIALSYSHTGFTALPCSTILFQAMSRINHIRNLASACETPEAIEDLLPLTTEVFAKIQSFDPNNWQEAYSTDYPYYPLIGTIFQLAIPLFAILSLPPALAAVFTYPPIDAQQLVDGDVADSTPTTDHEDARRRYRDHLRKVFRQGVADELVHEGLMWPAAVLGASLSDEEDGREDIRNFVGNARWAPGNDGGAFCLYEKLEEFWASGRTTWDQCFYEPINIIT